MSAFEFDAHHRLRASAGVCELFVGSVCLRWWPFHCIINYHFKEFGFINHFIWPSRPRSLKIQDSRTFYCQESIRVHRWVCKHFLVKRTYNSSFLYSTKNYLNKPMHRHWHEIQHEVANLTAAKQNLFFVNNDVVLTNDQATINHLYWGNDPSHIHPNATDKTVLATHWKCTERSVLQVCIDKYVLSGVLYIYIYCPCGQSVNVHKVPRKCPLS